MGTAQDTLRALTIGSFDPVHVDHVALFRTCEQLADHVVVGVNSDRFIQSYRYTPAVFSQTERMDMIEAIGYEVALNDGPGRKLIEAIRPDLLVVGNDWLERDYLAQTSITPQFLQERRIALVYLPRGETISATEMKKRMRA